VNRLADQLTQFAAMIAGLRGDRLDDWLTGVELTGVETDAQPELGLAGSRFHGAARTESGREPWR
jgi:hypothetical protein